MDDDVYFWVGLLISKPPTKPIVVVKMVSKIWRPLELVPTNVPIASDRKEPKRTRATVLITTFQTKALIAGVTSSATDCLASIVVSIMPPRMVEYLLSY